MSVLADALRIVTMVLAVWVLALLFALHCRRGWWPPGRRERAELAADSSYALLVLGTLTRRWQGHSAPDDALTWAGTVAILLGAVALWALYRERNGRAIGDG